jgi:hypothetical protein
MFERGDLVRGELMMNNKELQQKVREALENWDHEASGYSRICLAGLQAMKDTEFEQSEIDAHEDTYDDLSDWAHDVGLLTLEPSVIFVYNTLDVSEHEAKLRYKNSMDSFERELFATLYDEMCEKWTWNDVLEERQ